jgi:hypothetical protein
MNGMRMFLGAGNMIRDANMKSFQPMRLRKGRREKS